MHILRLDQLRTASDSTRPEGAPRLVSLRRNEATPGAMSRGGETLIVIHGSILVDLEGARVLELRPDAVGMIPPGTSWRMRAPDGPAEILVISRPRSEKDSDPEDTMEVTHNPWPGLNAIRRGVSNTFSMSDTFSPLLFGEAIGGDLLLSLDIEACSENQLKEVRRHCIERSRALVGLVLTLETLRDVKDFPRNSPLLSRVMSLRPRFIALMADLFHPDGIDVASIVRERWRERLAVDHAIPAIRSPLRPNHPDSVAALVRLLAAGKPHELSLILTVERQSSARLDEAMAILGQLLPWVGAIEFDDAEVAKAIEPMLERFCYQGWLLKRLR